MSHTYTDGFFYNPDGTSPADITRRIAVGGINPRLDDVFAVAIHETKESLRVINKRKDSLLSRRQEIEKELARIDRERQEIAARLDTQHATVAKYQRGDDLDETERELLTPKCASLIRDQHGKDTEAEFKPYAAAIPDGWEVASKRLDDDFIYVTLKRERASRQPPEVSVVKKIKKALDLFFAPGFKREDRVRLSDRLGSFSPIIPGVG